MRILLYCTLGLCAIVAAAIFGVTVSARTPLNTDYQPIKPELMPGSKYPDGSACFSHLRDGDNTYCQVYQTPGKLVWFTYNVRTKQITHTSILEDKAVGELLTIWGMPTGIDRLRYGVYVFWPGRYVFVRNGWIEPDSRIAFISYYTEPRRYQEWAGFVNTPLVDEDNAG